jgi:hypothetical protein
MTVQTGLTGAFYLVLGSWLTSVSERTRMKTPEWSTSPALSLVWKASTVSAFTLTLNHEAWGDALTAGFSRWPQVYINKSS